MTPQQNQQRITPRILIPPITRACAPAMSTHTNISCVKIFQKGNLSISHCENHTAHAGDGSELNGKSDKISGCVLF